MCPGYLNTAMWRDVLIQPLMERLGTDAEAAFQAHSAAHVPLGRPQTPEDIGQSVWFWLAFLALVAFLFYYANVISEFDASNIAYYLCNIPMALGLVMH